MSNWNTIPSNETVEKTAAALKTNGFEVAVVDTLADAKKKALEFIPEGAEVFTMTSVTLDTIGLSAALNAPGAYDSVRNKLGAMKAASQGREMRKLGAGPDVSVGSAHAVTETGVLLIASLTGSQLPAHAYGAGSVVLVVSSKKIVPNLDSAWKRLEEHVVPRESVRARAAYNLPDSFNSFPSKVLVINREIQPGRIKVILVNEDAGF